MLWAVPAAFAGTLGLVAFLRGMAAGAISIVAPLAGLSAVVPVTSASPPATTLGAADRGDRGRDPRRRARVARARRAGCSLAAGAGWGLLAALGFGLYFPPLHEASQVDPYLAVLVFRVTSVTLTCRRAAAAALAAAARARQLPLVALAGLFDVGGNLLYALASPSTASSASSRC